MKKQILIVGGDNRSPYIAQLLQKENYEVIIYGLERYPQLPPDVHITTQLISSDMYILPIPVTKDGKTIHAPYATKTILLEEINTLCRSESLVFAGKIPDPFAQQLNNKGVRYFDYGNRETFALANALPTAEGTIELVMNRTPYVIEGRSVCVVGYGKIGKVLSKKLQALGCRVTVTARKESQLQEIENSRFIPLHTYHLNNGPQFDIIINTVPAPVITADVINKQTSKCLMIDLASIPGGIDFEAARSKGITAIHALSLPAKHAPFTAAKIITTAILEFLHEME